MFSPYLLLQPSVFPSSWAGLSLRNYPAFDGARKTAVNIVDYMRRMGPFEPHRLPDEDMEYTTLPKVLEKLQDNFEEIDQPKKKEKLKVATRDMD